MANDGIANVGTRLPDGRISVVRQPVRQVSYAAPTCEAIVTFMLGYGLNADVPIKLMMAELHIVEAGGGGMGVYTGRVNKTERRRGSGYRIVPGKDANTIRLIQLR